MNILVIQGIESGVYYHRQYTPHYTWLDSGSDFADDFVVIVETRHLDKLVDVLSQYRFDLVYFSLRFVIPRNFITMLDFLRKRNTKLVLDIDDYFKGFNEMKKDLKAADAIITTSPQLQNFIYQRGGRNVHLIENGIDSKEEQFKLVDSPTDELWFGYLGSTRHEKDLESMLYKFDTENLHVVIPEYANILNVKSTSVLRTYQEYATEYDKIHVALAPLVPNQFNSCKSILKIVEAGFKKKALIATATEPYTRYKELSPAIDLIPSGESWERRVKSYTLSEATERGEQLYELVQDYEIRKLNQKRREIYNLIISK
jgi:hypothetical protein